jgi:hypothetical protein
VVPADERLHTLLVVVMVALALPLAVQIVVSFGRPGAVPGRRLTMAVPLIAGLVAVTVWRFVIGFVVPAIQGSWVGFSGPAGWLDGSAVLVAAAATGVLVFRSPRITPQAGSIASAAVAATAAGAVAQSMLETWTWHRFGLFGGWAGVALQLPGLVRAVVSAVLAHRLIRGLRRSAAWAAPGICVWGLAISLPQVLPQNLTSYLQGRTPFGAGAPVQGLDWAIGAVMVGAAVLLAPVVLMYRRSARRRRALMLSGAVIVLGVLLAELFGVQFVQTLILWAQGPNNPDGPHLSVVGLVLSGTGLLGAGLLVSAGVRLRRRPRQELLTAGAALAAMAQILPWGMSMAGLGTTFWFSGTAQLTGITGSRALSWDGYQLALALVLPILLVVLGARLQREQSDSAG